MSPGGEKGEPTITRKKRRVCIVSDDPAAGEGKPLPEGFVFDTTPPEGLSELPAFDKATLKVFDSATAVNLPGIFFGRLDKSVVPILSRVKRNARSWRAVQKTSGHLRYHNCDESLGLHNIFGNTVKEKDKIADGVILESALKAMIESNGFDPVDRFFHPGILYSEPEKSIVDLANPPEPQGPHTDWRDPREFFLVPKKDWPLACLIPVSDQGCWLQVWPHSGGRGLIIRLELGEVLFLHPQTVHGGCLGIGCPRVQAYITKDPTEAEHFNQHTNPATNVDYSEKYIQAIRRARDE